MVVSLTWRSLVAAQRPRRHVASAGSVGEPRFLRPLTFVDRPYASSVRAVVVGAGIGGLATAIALKQAGVEPILIERAPKLEEAGFGLVVSANAVTALRALGLRDAVAARGTRVRRAEIRTPRGELLTLIDYQALGWETYGILRAELQQAMLEVAPAECLRLGTLCTGGHRGRAGAPRGCPLGCRGRRRRCRRDPLGRAAVAVWGGAAALRRASRLASRNSLRERARPRPLCRGLGRRRRLRLWPSRAGSRVLVLLRDSARRRPRA
jgi:glycine/D-amino acid oxidase-like deaminating enzyme